jgi:hypothetical protein
MSELKLRPPKPSTFSATYEAYATGDWRRPTPPPLREHLSIRRLVGDGLVVLAFAVGKETRVAEVTLFVALNAVNGFPVSTPARLLFLRICHEIVRSILHSGRGNGLENCAGHGV